MKHLSFWFLLFVIADVYAQPANFQFNNYSIEDGLSQSTVYAILKDDLGYIWIGTRDGLNRFDGINFEKFYPSPVGLNAISHRSVRALVQDSEGFIWIGTDGGGVDWLNPRTNEFSKLCDLVVQQECESDANVTSLKLVEGDLLIGTRDQGLFGYNITNNNLTHQVYVESTIWDIEENEGRIFLATSQGVLHTGEDSTTTYLEGEEVRTLKFLDEKLLIGTRGKGVFTLDISKDEFSSFSPVLAAFEISSIEKDDSGLFWIGTDEAGIFIANENGEILEQLTALQQGLRQLPGNSIRTIVEDRHGIIWIGTNSYGISNYAPNRYQFNSYSKQSTNGKLFSDIILSFAELENGNLLIGTEQSGLLLFNRNNNSFEQIEAFKNESIVALLKDSKNQIWVATDGSGLKKIENQGNLNRIKEISNLTNLSVLSLAKAPGGELLVGTYKGFNIVSDDKVVPISNVPDFLQQDRILAIEPVGEERVLLGTFSNGLVLYDGRENLFRRIENSSETVSGKERVSERVQAIYTDSDRRIWLGTYSGLSLFDLEDETFSTLTTEDGLPSDVVYGILESPDKTLWLSTNSGISNFDFNSLSFKNYSVFDGMQSNEFNGGAFFEDSNGKFYFGSVKGFVEFNPSEIIEMKSQGALIVYSMIVDGEAFNTLVENEFSLKQSQDYIEFDFSYLNFINPEKYTLEYRLSENTGAWIPIKKSRDISVSGLSSGSYAFEIRALNYEGEVVASSEPVRFYVMPPFWMRWYFILGVILVIVSATWALFKYRMHYILKEEKTRNQIARDLHDDLSATLSSISFFSEAAKRSKDEQERSVQYLEMIDKSAGEAKEKINDIIWAIDPENDDWDTFLAKCKRYASEMFESKDIRYQIDLPEGQALKMSMDFKHDVWLTFKELVNNLVRHSSATLATISIKVLQKELTIEISDNGKGITQNDFTKGNGLKNMKFRVERLDGDIILDKNVKDGTKWKVRIPIKTA